MSLEEYLKLIRTEFSYLFKKYGFQVAFTEEYRPGHDWFHIGLESHVCKILFAREQGAGIMYLGTLDAPFDKEDGLRWMGMMSVLAYILNKGWDWSFLDNIPFKEQARASLSFSAKELEHVCGQVLDMFRSPEVVAKWKPAYEEYRQKKVR